MIKTFVPQRRDGERYQPDRGGSHGGDGLAPGHAQSPARRGRRLACRGAHSVAGLSSDRRAARDRRTLEVYPVPLRIPCRRRPAGVLHLRAVDATQPESVRRLRSAAVCRTRRANREAVRDRTAHTANHLSCDRLAGSSSSLHHPARLPQAEAEQPGDDRARTR